MPELVISSVSGAVLLRVDLAGRTKLAIGRSPKNDIRLTGKGVSRHHALLVEEAGCWFAIDLSAANGIFVGDTRARIVKIGDQSSIRIGEAHLWFYGVPDRRSQELPQPHTIEAPRITTRGEYLDLLWQEGTVPKAGQTTAAVA